VEPLTYGELLQLGLIKLVSTNPIRFAKTTQFVELLEQAKETGQGLRELLTKKGFLKPKTFRRAWLSEEAKARKKKPISGYLDKSGSVRCPLCKERLQYPQLDDHIGRMHGSHFLAYYKAMHEKWDCQTGVRAKFVSGGGPGTGKRR
jgi:hypothetical protein